jgi:hypothetical protein
LAVVRPLTVIVWAILVSRPNVPEHEATRYAKALQSVAKIHHFDPLTGVAMIHLESDFEPSSVSADGEDYGLGQIRARYVGPCKTDQDPVQNPSAECQALKQSLLDPEYNIRTMAELIASNRDFCRKKTGSALFHQWLASYQGRNYPGKRRWCKAGDKTWAVVRYRQRLLKELPRANLRRSRLGNPTVRTRIRD